MDSDINDGSRGDPRRKEQTWELDEVGPLTNQNLGLTY